METLAISIELAPDVALPANGHRDLELHVRRYAGELTRNLGLRAEAAVTVTAADPTVPLPGQFQVRIDGNVCRSRLWPHVQLDDLPMRELAAVLSESLHHDRVSLLTPALADSVARQWNVLVKGQYLNGWTSAGFHGYLSEFIRRNFSISRARSCAETAVQGITSDRDVQLLFEECLEDTENLQVGIALRVGRSQLTGGSEELAGMLSQWVRWIAIESGVVLPTIAMTPDDDLDDNDFRIQINDVLLPPIRAFPSSRKIAIAAKDAILKSGISSESIVDPIAGTVCQLVEISEETSAKLHSAGIQLLDQPSAVYIGWCVASAVKRNAGSLLAAPIVQFLLDRVKGDSPGLIRQAQSRLKDMSALSGRIGVLRWTMTAILRRLLDEQVTIRDFHAVLESLLYLRVLRTSEDRSRVVSFRTPVSIFYVAGRNSLRELSIADLSQGARFCLRSLMLRYTQATAKGTGFFPLVFSPQIQQRLLEAAARPLTAQEMDAFHRAVFDQVMRLGLDHDTSILVDQPLRMTVSELLCVEFPTIGIVGGAELARTVKDMAPAGVIDWPSDAGGAASIPQTARDSAA